MKNKSSSWLLTISLLLMALSAMTYLVHYLVFRDAYHIFFYLVMDLAFLFINVLLVILLIERLLAQREKRQIMRKLNMVIGMFFSEVGLEFMKMFDVYVKNCAALREDLDIKPQWTRKNFSAAITKAKSFPFEMKLDPRSLAALHGFFLKKKEFLSRLLENPNLLEHERFTDLLWAVFHLAEELSFREGKFDGLPPSDIQHLMSDLKRAYSHVTGEWIAYAEHLKASYPFLFSLAVRINPLGRDPSPIVT